MSRAGKLIIQNFLTYGARQELDLANRGVCLIEGENLDDSSASSNGTGKSAISDALAWCRYGRTLRGLRGDDVVNRFVEHDCEVTHHFEVDGTWYVLSRYRRHRQKKNALELMTAAGVRLTRGSIEETQQEVIKLFGMDYDTFAALLCGQGVLQPFSAMTDAQAKSAMEEFFKLTLYADAAKLSGRKLAETRGRLEELERRVEEHGSSLSDTKRELSELREKARLVDKERKSRIEAAEDDLHALEKSAEKLRQEIRQAKQQRATVKELEKQEADEQQVWADSSTSAAKLERDLELKARSLKELRSHEHEVGQVCTRCGGTIDASNLDHLIVQTRQELSALKEKMPLIEKRRDEAGDNLARIRSDLKTARAALQLSGRLENELLDKERQVKKAREHLKEVALVKYGYDELIDKASARKEATYKKLQAARQELEESRPLAAALEFWAKGFGNKGLKSLVLDSQLPFLNQKADEFSRVMTDGNLVVKFRTTKVGKSGQEEDSFGVDVVNRYGGETYQANSAGERRKVDIVVSLALLSLVAAKARSVLSCIFLDEVFDGLDGEGLERALQIITEELSGYESVFVISHRRDLADYFSTTIRVTKKDRTSIIND